MPVQAGTLSRDGHESSARADVTGYAKGIAQDTHRAHVYKKAKRSSRYARWTKSKRYAHSAEARRSLRSAKAGRHLPSAKANRYARSAKGSRHAAHRKAHRVASIKRHQVRIAQSRRTSPARTAAVTGHHQTGVASYYWQPQRVASGGWFNPRAMTAAHKSLPFGTKVRVTHLGSGRSVDVTINDRGPYIGGRIIDLSTAAAEQLGMKSAGLARVKLEVLGR